MKYLSVFLLSTGYGECLLDEPSGRTYNLPNQLPGQLYNANRQCELMFGPGSQVCPFMVRHLNKLQQWTPNVSVTPEVSDHPVSERSQNRVALCVGLSSFCEAV